MKNNLIKIALVAVISSLATVGALKLFGLGGSKDVVFAEAGSGSLGKLASFGTPAAGSTDFTYAAEISTPAVVHIKVKSMAKQQSSSRRNPFEDFFGGGGIEDFFGQRGPQESSGSGVILSADGYIVTNNHVVEGGTELEVVTADKKSFSAKVVGADPNTDIAVIKIEANNLPTMAFGNSDATRVGEWVLAVGNPFNLESTVTAGIVSAKSRSINILGQNRRNSSSRTDSPIESFIQTDAAVNPGNSGGALVNLKGELIGINTAIASPNGAYAGYAFAVPATMVKKVTSDLVKFGNVQRGYLGITPVELNTKIAKELDIEDTEGIYVNSVEKTGAAKAAGIKEKDVIVKIDGQTVNAEPKFRELIGRKRPGENVIVTVKRGSTLKDYTVTLRNLEGGKDMLAPDLNNTSFSKMGLNLEEITEEEKRRTGVKAGVVVKGIDADGEIAAYTDLQEGLIITKVDEKAIATVKDFKEAVAAARSSKKDGVLICGVYKGYSRNYCYGLPFN